MSLVDQVNPHFSLLRGRTATSNTGASQQACSQTEVDVYDSLHARTRQFHACAQTNPTTSHMPKPFKPLSGYPDPDFHLKSICFYICLLFMQLSLPQYVPASNCLAHCALLY